MIKGITAGRYINIQNGQPASNYVNNYSGGQGVGNVRFNTTTQNMEVFDGNNWMQLAMNYAQVELNGEAQMLLDWARQERNRQAQRQSLIQNNPALQKAWEAIQRAEANFDLLEKFVEHDNPSEGQFVMSSP